MEPFTLQTKRLRLILQSPEEARRQVAESAAQGNPPARADNLASFQAAVSADPWTHGFRIVDSAQGTAIGYAAFKGPPTETGEVEIAYFVTPELEGRGYATEAAAALTEYAFKTDRVRVVRAHTLPEAGASKRVLEKCGFRFAGEVLDPEDGLVWRWEKLRNAPP